MSPSHFPKHARMHLRAFCTVASPADEGYCAVVSSDPSDAKDKLIRQMSTLAKNVSERAYCPYSNFRVGAAVLASSGSIYVGCNVENAAYGSTICAERGAIMQMIAGGDTSIEALVIYTPTSAASHPCGACRQVIHEFGHSARIVSVCDSSDVFSDTHDTLLPSPFGPENLT